MRLLVWEGDSGAAALREGEREWTRGELHAAALRGAAIAEAAGVREGTLCALFVRPTAAGIAAYASALASPGAVLALNPASTRDELAQALVRMRPAAVMVEPGTRGTIEAALAQAGAASHAKASAQRFDDSPAPTPAILEFTAVGEPPRVSGGPEPHPARIASDRALVVWTSGTTGAPRAVALRGEGIVAAAEAQVARMGVEEGQAMVASLPLAPVGGLMIPLRAALAGAVIEALPAFDAEEVVALAAGGRADHVSLVPVMLRRLVEALEGADPAQPASFRTLLIGGAACPPELVARSHACGLDLALTWGMTESCAQVATASPDEVRRDAGSVGLPLVHVAVRVEDDGRLALHLPALAPAEFEPASGTDGLRPLCDAGGWFVTGDLGIVADDGHIRLTGRASDRIITGGVNVDPGEVEQLLRTHPAVADAAVVGVPDAEWGERVCAVVVAAPGCDIDVDELTEWMRDRVSAAKRPRAWRVVDHVPSSVAGKIDRTGVRALFGG